MGNIGELRSSNSSKTVKVPSWGKVRYVGIKLGSSGVMCRQVLQVCTSLRDPVLVELIQGQCLIAMRKMLSQLITVLEYQTLKSRKITELHQGQGHTLVRDIPEHHREVWGLEDPKLPRHTDLPPGQGHRQVEGSQGNTPLKGRIDVTAKCQTQSQGQGHTQDYCRGQDKSIAIQGSLEKRYEEKET